MLRKGAGLHFDGFTGERWSGQSIIYRTFPTLAGACSTKRGYGVGSAQIIFIKIAHYPRFSSVELLCEDHVGTYVIPFLCRRTGEDWRSVKTGERIQATVIGWNARTERE